MRALALRRLLRLAPASPEGRALDVGTGDGATAARLRRAWPRLRFVGVDRLDAGRARSGLGEGAPLATADSRRLPFRDAAFDVVVCSHVLHHVDGFAIALPEARRVLAPGGVLLVAELSEEVLPSGDAHGHAHAPARGLHVHARLDAAAWEAAIRTAGFDVLAREGRRAIALVARRPVNA
jgi:malonyl-CoA O-methyltransferase